MTRAPLIVVTGLSGFIAKHCALELLRRGYRVRGTLRDPARADDIVQTLSAHTDTERLEFAAADLLDDDGWDQAMEGARAVLHVASPFPLRPPKHEDELIRPAVDGTLRVLTAAVEAGVTRFVQTSSTAAVMEGYGGTDGVLTEMDWTRIDGPHVSAYAKSKTMAELAARAFVADPELKLHYTSIAPGFVLGPLLDARAGSSALTVARFMKGKVPGCPRLSLPVVDVRDVAIAHRLALENREPSGARYIAAQRVASFRDIMTSIKGKLGGAARRVPTRELPDAAVKLIGLFDPAASSITHALGHVPRIDNRATQAKLGMRFIPVEVSAPAMGESLVKFGLV
jgi:dihydroflavonol-4-reductase